MNRAPQRGIRAAIFVVFVPVAALVGCTKAPVQVQASAPEPSITVETSTATESPTNTAAASTSVPATTAPARSTASASVSPIPSPSVTRDPNACTSAELTVTAERGSGLAGKQYTTLRFTNSGKRTCTLTGFPTAQFVLGGQLIGTPATHSKAAITAVSLRPGTSAVSALVNDSTCNAANSDGVSVTPPGGTVAVTAPITRRPCSMVVDPVSAG